MLCVFHGKCRLLENMVPLGISSCAQRSQSHSKLLRVPNLAAQAGEFSHSAWPDGPRRLPLDRPRSAQYTRENQYKSPYAQSRPNSAGRPSSAGRPGSGRQRPCSARPASRPSSARPASGRPQSARATARPASTRPSSARPSSGRPSSGKAPVQPVPPKNSTRPQSAPMCMEMRHNSLASVRPRPASAMPAAHCPDAKGVSILFQQQQYLEKQIAEQGLNSQSPGFATLMRDWVSSYQKSRIRARMACRPLWGEGRVCKRLPKSPKGSKKGIPQKTALLHRVHYGVIGGCVEVPFLGSSRGFGLVSWVLGSR